GHAGLGRGRGGHEALRVPARPRRPRPPARAAGRVQPAPGAAHRRAEQPRVPAPPGQPVGSPPARARRASRPPTPGVPQASRGRMAPPVHRRWVAVDHPAWRQAHASTVLAVDGDLLAAWFAGEHEGSPDTRIWLARRPAGAARWTAPEIVVEGGEAHWNPVLALGPDGAVWLFAKRGPLISRWTTWVRRSVDGGRTWSPEYPLVPGDVGGRGPVKNPPLLLGDGTWLAPG